MRAGRSLSAAVVAVAAVALTTAPARADEVVLPAIPQVLPDSRGCTATSGRHTDQVPWHQARTGVADAWRFSRGAGVLVAVLDTGADTSSPALRDRVRPGPDVVAGGPAQGDCVGHGTLAAGLVAAAPQPGAGLAGVAPDARVLAVRVTDGRGNTNADALAVGLRAAVEARAAVVAVLPGVSAGNDALREAVRLAAERRVLVVAAATVEGQQRDGEVYPAAYPEVLSVAALGPDGPVTTPRGATVDLLAPGDKLTGLGPGGGHFTAGGPGFAAAYTAATAALVLARHPRLGPAELVQRLERTGYPVGDHPAVDPVAALTAVLPSAGRAAPAEALPAVPGPPTRPGVAVAVAVAAGAVGVAALLGIAAAVLPRGRRRRWRPGGRWAAGSR
ncbi:S8 family serine peptidase [Actinosynnema sp. NPDC053489]|uniref:S8 family serine peptidase n=1 Tax=Actinosynnema sp. NPDC053489 TaxID=3363916 RepID=UPI0037C9F0CF